MDIEEEVHKSKLQGLEFLKRMAEEGISFPGMLTACEVVTSSVISQFVKREYQAAVIQQFCETLEEGVKQSNKLLDGQKRTTTVS